MQIADRILNAQGNASLGNEPWAVWDAVLRLSEAGSPGASASGGRKAFTEFLTHMQSVLSENHPMLRKFRQMFSQQLNSEAQLV